jgi:uncharacterized protein
LEKSDFHIKGQTGRDLWGSLNLPKDPQHPAVVMVHGALGFKDWAFFPWLAGFLAEAGFPVARFNFSGSGMGPQTDGPFTDLEAFQADTISRQVEDLRAVVQNLIQGRLSPELPAQRNVFLWGHSRGGAACLLAAGGLPAVRAVAAWATISRVNRYLFEVKQAWRKQGFLTQESSRTGQLLKYSTGFLDDVEKWGKEGDLPTYLHNLNLPVLLVHGSEDTSVPPEESESLAAVNPRAQLAILAGANHKFNSLHPFTEPSAVLTEAARRTAEFYLSITC